MHIACEICGLGAAKVRSRVEITVLLSVGRTHVSRRSQRIYRIIRLETQFLIPLCFLCYLLFKISSVPSVTKLGGMTNSEGQVKYCRCTFFGYATPDRAGARPYHVQCRVARCDIGLPAHTSHPFASFRVFRGPHSLGKAGSRHLDSSLMGIL